MKHGSFFLLFYIISGKIVILWKTQDCRFSTLINSLANGKHRFSMIINNLACLTSIFESINIMIGLKEFRMASFATLHKAKSNKLNYKTLQNFLLWAFLACNYLAGVGGVLRHGATLRALRMPLAWHDPPALRVRPAVPRQCGRICQGSQPAQPPASRQDRRL